MNNEHDTVGTTDERKPKRASVTLIAGQGKATIRLTVLARRTRNDGGETTVTTTDASDKATRGMTVKYDTFDLAVAGMKQLAQDAMKKGWSKVERVGRFKPRPDAFSTLPVAPKTPR